MQVGSIIAVMIPIPVLLLDSDLHAAQKLLAIALPCLVEVWQLLASRVNNSEPHVLRTAAA
jgi:hypothetical protein|eukprot:COSAG01_NODE_5188_length_4423_cov_6.890148_6_plen_61_part_00